MMLDYFQSSGFKSHKSKRFFLIEEYYKLCDMKAFKEDNDYNKAWQVFIQKWNKLKIESNLFFRLF